MMLNPYCRATFNLTEQMRLELRDPSLANKLRSEAELVPDEREVEANRALRHNALEKAIIARDFSESTEQIVHAATAFYEFLKFGKDPLGEREAEANKVPSEAPSPPSEPLMDAGLVDGALAGVDVGMTTPGLDYDGVSLTVQSSAADAISATTINAPPPSETLTFATNGAAPIGEVDVGS